MELNPYILYNGTCKQALEFYKEALDGQIVNMSTFGEAPPGIVEGNKDLVMHATFTFGSAMLMASDAPASHPVPDNGNVHLSINFQDIPTMEEKFNKLSEGGKVTMPVADTFWGARFGMLTDKFGINWMFNCELKK